MQAIRFENVDVLFGGRLALENISVGIDDKSFVVVFGPNGAGKTTFLKVMLGQLRPSRGRVLLLDGEIKNNTRHVGYVPQGVFEKKTFPIRVLSVVLMGLNRSIGLFRYPGNEHVNAARAALATVGMEDFENYHLAELSGGQRQRIFIARALVSKPRILLLDEATSGVDAGARESLYNLLVRLKKEMTVVFVTHDMGVISKEVDSVLCLNRTLVSHGRPEVALSPENLACMYGEGVAMFSHCNLPHVHVHSHS